MKKEIIIDFPESGGLHYCTQYYHGTEKFRTMIIPGCARCLGVFIFWKPKDPSRHAIHAVTALHIPPCGGGRVLKKNAKKIRKILFKAMKEFSPYFIIVGGGKVNNLVNQTHYKRSLTKYVEPFLYIFPDLQKLQIPSSRRTLLSTLILGADGSLKVYTKSSPSTDP